jgi:hypothetical protein
MRKTYTKLFHSILASSIWQEAPETKIVWITLLAMVDAKGEVEAAVPGLASMAGVSIPACEAALQVLRSPDPYSRSTESEGRRVEDVDGGWRLLNHAKYVRMASQAEVSETNRVRKAAYRAKKADCVPNVPSGPDNRDRDRDRDILTPSTASAVSSPAGGASPRKVSRRPTRGDIKAAIGQRVALQTVPGLLQAIEDWDAALPSKKRWKSAAALSRRLNTLEKNEDKALRMVEICTAEEWSDPQHALKVISEENGETKSNYVSGNNPKYYR